jgi:hypothetical protein
MIGHTHTRNIIAVIVSFLVTIAFTSCGIYSFKQGSIPPEIKTVSIANIYNESGGGPANISQIFTEKLKNYYQQNSRLLVVNSNGDWQLEGKITSYQTSPAAPQGNTSALSRLTINLQIKFINPSDERANFEQGFSFFENYDPAQTLTLVETDLIQLISDQIVIDIFNKTTSNW